MTTYSLANDDLREHLDEVMSLYHPHLRDAGVRVDMLPAYAAQDMNGDTTGPAIKLGGHACYAVIRILGLRDRVAGRGDAEMVVDGDNWDTWDEDQLRAILDHELCHLELKVSDKGTVKRDDHDRPQLRLRQHDRHFGWFDAVARRHGSSSIEVQHASQLAAMADLRQLYLPGMDTGTRTTKRRAGR